MKIEQALAKLEEITATLERGELPLDDAIGLFEEGLALAADTKRQLDAARLRVDQIVEQAKDTLDVEPFDVS
ncbi:MAG: exodeoxyribonuclease VII small subunit [Candidatus Bipolaricaulota bacterium]|jgi:exodeoxyribonuclease VII small subunit|nr:exodeoxyribonuclease VII small subunit [Candidatus Bipolaricaulota bacterium]